LTNDIVINKPFCVIVGGSGLSKGEEASFGAWLPLTE
jgi:hypothetical protein